MSILISSIAEQKQVKGLDFPLVLNAPDHEVAQSEEHFHLWLRDNRKALQALLIKHGAVLFRGFPVACAQQFENMLDQTDFVNMPYVGGAAPRSLVTSSRIVTANESPASEKIPFHHEMAQVATPPGYIFFYCDIAPKEGGATSLLHSGEICEKFFEINASFARKIEQQGVRYRRVMPEQTDKNSAIGRSWRETFQVETRQQAERAMQEAGMSWEWLDDGSIRTETKTLEAVRVDQESGQKVFFNSIVAVFSGWNDSRNIGVNSVVSDDKEQMDKEVIDQLIEQMDKLSVNFKWQTGDVLWVNNHTVMHARQPYVGDRLTLASIAYK
ncbi:MAG: taurine catabolism dioxygenase tauD/tfdA [Osedax symbiont Rs2]|nr:MAG: taurine catabolism dioxygenase tauD/tfdA [Osedax symbiont Rs2]